MNTAFAQQLGETFANELRTSADRDNWSPLGRCDDLPNEDYRLLAGHYRFDALTQEQIAEIEAAYRKAFNAAFTA